MAKGRETVLRAEMHGDIPRRPDEPTTNRAPHSARGRDKHAIDKCDSPLCSQNMVAELTARPILCDRQQKHDEVTASTRFRKRYGVVWRATWSR